MIRVGKNKITGGIIMSKSTSVFDIDGKPSIGKALPLSIQHVLAMVIGNITPCIMIAGIVGLSDTDRTIFVQSGLLIAGLATLLQLYPIWKFGARLPMIMGVSFAYIPTLIAVGTMMGPHGQIIGIQGIFGAQIVGGFVGILVGVFIKPLRKYFPPIVAGTVVLTIGLSLYTVAIGYVAGGNGAKGNVAIVTEMKESIKGGTLTAGLKENAVKNKYVPGSLKGQIKEADTVTPELKSNMESSIKQLEKTSYGSLYNWLLAAVTLLVVLICNQFGKGYFKLASILIGIVAGYALGLALGMVDFTPVTNAGLISVPTPFYFKPTFHVQAIISMAIIYVVNSIQAVGDFSATTMGGMGRELTDDELAGGIIGSGTGSIIGAIFGGLPLATYSQNVGIVATTKVVSRFVLAISAVVILVAGLIPKLGALMTTIPEAVLGGATITVFGSITMTGIKLIMEDELSVRNVTLVGLAVAIGVGIKQTNALTDGQLLSQLPMWVDNIFGSSEVAMATIIAFVLNIILPKKSLADEQAERDALES